MFIPLMRAGVLLVAATVSTAFAAESHRCAAIAEPAERLACYDAEFPPTVGAASLESLREKELKEFGLSQIQRRDNLPESQRASIPDRIEATVSSVRTLAAGERTVTLDNGQVWLLSEVTTKGQLATGDRVVIRRAAMATFMLITPGRIALRAKRLQ